MGEKIRLQPNDNVSSYMSMWHNVFRPDWQTMIGVGYIDGAEAHRATFYVEDLDANDGEVGIVGGSLQSTHQALPALLEVDTQFYAVSDSASDTATLRVWGVLAGNDEVVMDVTLTGTTPVALPSTCIHVNEIKYLNGATQNVGHVSCSTKAVAGVPVITTDRLQCEIEVGHGCAYNPRILCPNNQVYAFQSIDIMADRADGIHVRWYQRDGDGNVCVEEQWLVYQAAHADHFVVPQSIAAGEYIEMTCERSAAGTGTTNLSMNVTYYVMNPGVRNVSVHQNRTASGSVLWRPVDE